MVLYQIEWARFLPIFIAQPLSAILFVALAIKILIRKKDQLSQSSDKINAPILFIRRIVTDRSIETLKNSFDLPKTETVDELIKRVREEKTKSDALLSSLEDMKDKK